MSTNNKADKLTIVHHAYHAKLWAENCSRILRAVAAACRLKIKPLNDVPTQMSPGTQHARWEPFHPQHGVADTFELGFGENPRQHPHTHAAAQTLLSMPPRPCGLLIRSTGYHNRSSPSLRRPVGVRLAWRTRREKRGDRREIHRVHLAGCQVSAVMVYVVVTKSGWTTTSLVSYCGYWAVLAKPR